MVLSIIEILAYFSKIPKSNAAHLETSHGTLVCRGTQVENHCSIYYICTMFENPGGPPCPTADVHGNGIYPLAQPNKIIGGIVPRFPRDLCLDGCTLVLSLFPMSNRCFTTW